MKALAFLLLTSPVLAFQADTTGEENTFSIRTVLVSVADAQGVPLEGLAVEDFQVEETGVTRDIVDVQGEIGQEIFLLVDTGIGFQEEIPSLRKGVEAFASELEEPHEVLMAGFGGAVHHLAGPTSDPDVLARAAARIARGLGAMYLLDAVADVCSGVAVARREESEPPVVVIVSALTPDVSLTPIEDVYRFAQESEARFYIFLYDPPQRSSHYERRALMENFLATLAQVTGGGFEKILAGAALPVELGELGAELMQPGYRLSFLTEVEPRTTLESLSIRVTREGTRVHPIRLLRHERIVTTSGAEEASQ